MIYGIGTDVCDLRRIRATLERRGERFAQKVLGPSEIEVFRARRARVEERGIAYLGTRFSAKEAFSKAIGLGLRMPMTWRACEILNHASGQPYIRLHGALSEWFDARALEAHVSVSDESEYAASFVAVEHKASFVAVEHKASFVAVEHKASFVAGEHKASFVAVEHKDAR